MITNVVDFEEDYSILVDLPGDDPPTPDMIQWLWTGSGAQSLLTEDMIAEIIELVHALHENDIRFKVVGDVSRFDRRIRELITEGEVLTAANKRLTLTIAANYGGRWDIGQAARRYFAAHPDAAQPGQFTPEAIEP